MKRTAWRPVVRGEVARKARAIAVEVGRRVAGPGTTHASASGPLLAAYLDRCVPGQGWDAVGRALVASSTQRIAQPGADCGLGLPEGLIPLAFAAQMLAQDGKAARSLGRLCMKFDSLLLPILRRNAARLSGLKGGMATGEFDLYGLTGLSIYALSRRSRPAAAAGLRSALKAFIAMTREDSPVPHWHTSHGELKLRREMDADRYPYGLLNCSLSHGISGPLTIMSLALLSGVKLEGLRETTGRLARWLAAQRREKGGMTIWSRGVPVRPQGKTVESLRFYLNPSWCNGVPGILRALWHAGAATNDWFQRELSATVLEAMIPGIPEGFSASPYFCHGMAGVLQVTLRFAHDSGLLSLRRAAAGLTERIVESFDPRALSRPDAPFDLFEGATGVALVLLAASSDEEPVWDRLVLLS